MTNMQQYNLEASLKLTVLSLLADMDVPIETDRMELAREMYDWVKESVPETEKKVTNLTSIN